MVRDRVKRCSAGVGRDRPCQRIINASIVARHYCNAMCGDDLQLHVSA
jgi:hypothetical protein